MKLIRDYARLLIFAAGILIGVQIPNFVDQYAKRISAHYAEAENNFSGYRQTADRNFGGDVAALLEHYAASRDSVFKSDAENVRRIYEREQAFARESNALKASLFKRLFHVAFYADGVVLKETIAEFSYTVPLNADAIVCGLALGLLLSLLFDMLVKGIAGLCGVAVGKGPQTTVRPC